MLASVSSSSSLPSMGRAVLTEGATVAHSSGQDPAGTVHAESVRAVQPVTPSDTDQRAYRSRVSGAFFPSTSDAGESSDTTYRIPSRLTLEIQKAREAIAETGGGIRAMKDFMQALAQQPAPTVSLTI